MPNYRLFTYGTLMIPQVFKKVTGLYPKTTPGVLLNYDCFRLKNQTYPGIVFKPRASTNGIVYFDLTQETIKKLDVFEGDLYDRVSVSVSLETNTVDAFVYVLKPQAQHYLSNDRWSKTEFETQNLQAFLNNDPGFNESSREKTFK